MQESGLALDDSKIGASAPAEPTMIARLAGIYMNSGPSSCGQFVQHMQAAESF